MMNGIYTLINTNLITRLSRGPRYDLKLPNRRFQGNWSAGNGDYEDNHSRYSDGGAYLQGELGIDHYKENWGLTTIHRPREMLLFTLKIISYTSHLPSINQS